MATTRIALILLLLPLFSVRASFAQTDSRRPAFTAEQFADRLTEVVYLVNQHYYHEIEHGQLLRVAMHGLYEHHQRKIPDWLSRPLATARAMERKDLSRLLTAVAKDWRFDLRAAADVALERMLGTLDGRTKVFEIGDQPAAGLEGIGVKLDVDPTTGFLRVAYPYLNGPAYRAGLRSGDIITEIARFQPDAPGKPRSGVDVVPAKHLSVARGDSLLSGVSGQSVHMFVNRPGSRKWRHFTVQHGRAEPETVLGLVRQQDERWDHWLDADRKIGYLRLTAIRSDTYRIVTDQLAALHSQGMQGLVLDLRGNAGGLVVEATKIAGMLVGDAPLYSIRGRDEEDDTFRGASAKTFCDFPIVCLTDRDTVRMGEVLAACLQDNRRAVIIGQRTAGDASIHFYAGHGNTFLVTITARVFFRPSGKKLNRIHSPGQPSDEWGVTPDPDYEVILSSKEHDELRAHLDRQFEIWPERSAKREIPRFKDRQLERAVECLRGKLGKSD